MMQQLEPDPTQADDGGAASIEKDRLLPIANVSRLMKRALPENAKIAKDAKDCLQECVSEFISFVTSEASDRCTLEKRKTVSGDDIIFALQSLGFDNYSETLKIYLAKYKEVLPHLHSIFTGEGNARI
ncbi:transcription factor NF-Y [Chytriomyces cf. hyalinus JEL632]|nr:transcription factor NF-Y [Chytriomyces cf. hyalinus JEL632]